MALDEFQSRPSPGSAGMTERKIEVYLKEDRDPVSVIPAHAGIVRP